VRARPGLSLTGTMCYEPGAAPAEANLTLPDELQALLPTLEPTATPEAAVTLLPTPSLVATDVPMLPTPSPFPIPEGSEGGAGRE
jgi:hypothetical protein